MTRACALLLVSLALPACGSHAPASHAGDGGDADGAGDRTEAARDVAAREDVATPDLAERADTPDALASEAPDASADGLADAAVDGPADVFESASADAPTSDAPDAPAGGSSDAPASGDTAGGERDAPPAEAGPSQWLTLGGDQLRSGFNRVERGRPPLSFAWRATVDPDGRALWPAVSDGKTAYATAIMERPDRTVHVLAFAVSDGAPIWEHTFDNLPSSSTGPSQLTLTDDHVLLSCCESEMKIEALFASTGKAHWSMASSRPFHQSVWAPLAFDNDVIVGNSPNLCALDEHSGMPLHCDLNGNWTFLSSLALEGTVYTQFGARLWAADPVTGLNTRMITFDGFYDSYSETGVPASDGKNLYVVSPPKLRAFTPDLTPGWVAVGGFQIGPVIAGHVVLAIGSGKLKALDALTGDPLWTFASDQAFTYPPVIANGFAYVANGDAVYAVDLATGKTGADAWAAKPGGWLSIAGGRLFVAQTNGTLTAYSFTR